MRAWADLTARKQIKRALYATIGFIRRYIWGCYRGWGVVGLYHWIRCHAWNRYHIIDLRHSEHYDWGWIDRDNAMWLACWRIFQDFMEREYPGYVDWEYHKLDDGRTAKQELEELYAWWNGGRKKEHATCNELLDGWDYEFDEGHMKAVGDRERRAAWSKMAHELEEKDEEMFNRLMRVRHYLWT